LLVPLWRGCPKGGRGIAQIIRANSSLCLPTSPSKGEVPP